MSTITMTNQMVSRPNQLNIYLQEAKAEFLSVWRTPGFTVPTITFPIVFYFFFGVLFGQQGVTQQATYLLATYLLATYGTFGIMGPCLQGFGQNLANERDQGWLLLKRISPMPVSAYFCAKIITATIFSAMVVGILGTMAAFAANVSLAPSQWFLLALILLLGTLPFCALGLAIGSWVSARSAAAVVNMVYLPMGLFAGLWMPIVFFPDFLKVFAMTLPAYHLAELALQAVGMNENPKPWINTAVLVAYTVVSLLIARQGFRRNA